MKSNESVLFAGLTEAEAEEEIRKLRGTTEKVSVGQTVLHQGEIPQRWGILLSGELNACRYGENGEETVLAVRTKNEVFAEMLVFSHLPSPIALSARTEAEILWLDRIRPKIAHPILMENLMKLLSVEYLELHEKIRYCSIKNLRKRILSYLSSHAQNGKAVLNVDRNGMAAYLNADRSALSRELMRMKNEGLISYRKNVFYLY